MSIWLVVEVGVIVAVEIVFCVAQLFVENDVVKGTSTT
jgi:hypothetical protein